jgi:ABC-type dipeptide/oligopeptide/nickel transport system permease component
LKLYQYILRRLALMIIVLLALSVLIFYLTRGLLPPTTAMAAYITPRMDDAAKLSVARAVGVATGSCPSYADFTRLQNGCVVPIWVGQLGVFSFA